MEMRKERGKLERVSRGGGGGGELRIEYKQRKQRSPYLHGEEGEKRRECLRETLLGNKYMYI